MFIERIKSNPETVKLGVISNFDDRLGNSYSIHIFHTLIFHSRAEGLLESLGIREFFDFVLVSYNERNHKPHPQ